MNDIEHTKLALRSSLYSDSYDDFMMNSTDNSTCPESLAISSNYWFWVIKGMKLTMSFPAIILNVILMVVLRRCSLLHTNVKCLLINMCVCSSGASMYILVKSLYTILAYVFGSPCVFEVTFRTCKLQEFLFVFFKLPVICSLLGLSVERSYASQKIETYEKKDSSTLAKCILVTTWSFSVIVTIILLETVDNKAIIPYCNTVFVYDPTVFRVLCGILLPMEICGVAMYLILYYKTSKQIELVSTNRAQYNLSGRLQKFLTLSLTSAMLPSVVLHAVCWITIFGFAAVQTTLIHLPYENQLILSLFLFYGLCLLHMTLHPLACFYKCDIIRYELLEIFPRLHNYIPSSKRLVVFRQFSNEEQKHFELLYNMWNVDNNHSNRILLKYESRKKREKSRIIPRAPESKF